MPLSKQEKEMKVREFLAFVISNLSRREILELLIDLNKILEHNNGNKNQDIIQG